MLILIVAIMMITVDVFWLTFFHQIYSPLYPILNTIQPTSPTYYLITLTLAYTFFAAGIINFVIPKSQGSIKYAFFNGALFGLIINGVFQFSDLAVINHWIWRISIIDTIYTMLMTALVSCFVLIYKRIKNPKQKFAK